MTAIPTINTSLVRQFFEASYPLNHEGLNELLGLFKVKVFEKGEHLLKAGQVEKRLRFMNFGVVREFYSTVEKESNINFYTQPQFLTDLPSFMHDQPTRKYQEVLETAELIYIEKEPFVDLLEKYSCGKALIEQSFQQLLKHKEKMEYDRLTKSPEEMYGHLCKTKRHWLQQIPQYHLASYLDITPETLSRIRKRMIS